MSDHIKHTEVDGLEASWTLDDHEIGIVGVYDTSGNLPVVSIDHGSYPDLAEARERWPKLTRLWNAVRHDFWSEIASHNHRSRILRTEG
jgi:hypothetical protein